MSERIQHTIGDVEKGDRVTFLLANGLSIANEAELTGPMLFDEADSPEYRVMKVWVNDELRLDLSKNRPGMDKT